MEPNTLASHDAAGHGSERSASPDPLYASAEPRLAFDVGPGHHAADSRPALASAMPATIRPPVHGNGTNGHSHSAARPGVSTLDHAARASLTLQSVAGTVYLPTAAAARQRATFYLRLGKRWLDFAGAMLGLVLAAPVLLVAAIAIKLESNGPVLYRSKRIGRGGKPFTFFKLRSMVDGADNHRHHLTHLNETDGPVFKMSRDPRVTRVGRFLRTSSLDELPQLFNVLRGDMSLVGPRPPIAEEVVQYEPWQFRRLEVRPGLTCLWQISGRSRIGFQEWMRLDLEYIRQQSFWLDIRILLRTIPAVLSREGAY